MPRVNMVLTEDDIREAITFWLMKDGHMAEDGNVHFDVSELTLGPMEHTAGYKISARVEDVVIGVVLGDNTNAEGWMEGLAEKVSQELAKFGSHKHPDIAAMPTAVRILAMVQKAFGSRR